LNIALSKIKATFPSWDSGWQSFSKGKLITFIDLMLHYLATVSMGINPVSTSIILHLMSKIIWY
jgi:hypothetical protein